MLEVCIVDFNSSECVKLVLIWIKMLMLVRFLREWSANFLILNVMSCMQSSILQKQNSVLM